MEPTGFVHNAAILCPDCAKNLEFPFFDRDMGKEVNSTDDMNAIFSTDETDFPESCDSCFTEIRTSAIHELDCPDCGNPNSVCTCEES